MILEVTLDELDELEVHREYENLFQKSKGGIIPVKLTGNFRFSTEFEIIQTHMYRRITKFKLYLINAEQKIKLYTRGEGD